MKALICCGVKSLPSIVGLPVGAHVALDGPDGAVDVGDRLPLGDLADEDLAVLGERDDGRRGAGALGVGDDRRLAALEDADDGVGGAEVDADRSCHGWCSLSARYVVEPAGVTPIQDPSDLEPSRLNKIPTPPRTPAVRPSPDARLYARLACAERPDAAAALPRAVAALGPIVVAVVLGAGSRGLRLPALTCRHGTLGGC